MYEIYLRIFIRLFGLGNEQDTNLAAAGRIQQCVLCLCIRGGADNSIRSHMYKPIPFNESTMYDFVKCC